MKRKREKLNLSIDSEVLKFAKKWSYVNQKPISRFVEDLFRERMDFTKGLTPDIYLFDR